MDWPGHISKHTMDSYLKELSNPYRLDTLHHYTWNWICSSIYWLRLSSQEREVWWK